MKLLRLSIWNVVNEHKELNFYLNIYMWLAATVLDHEGFGETSANLWSPPSYETLCPQTSCLGSPELLPLCQFRGAASFAQDPFPHEVL